jgi:hypothetical protein
MMTVRELQERIESLQILADSIDLEFGTPSELVNLSTTISDLEILRGEADALLDALYEIEKELDE